MMSRSPALPRPARRAAAPGVPPCRVVASRMVVAVAAVGVFTACQSQPPPTGPSTSTASGVAATSTGLGRPAAPPSVADTPTPVAPVPTVVLDPGHNGGNAAHPREINRLVPDGRGRMKPCNTTGTATNDGYPEHEFAWDVATRVRAMLEAEGVRVVLTRQNNTGVGPCVNDRAAMANDSGARAVVSIHADGVTTPGSRGFHIAHSRPPLNDTQNGPGLRLATALRDGLREGGLTPSNYVGGDGLSPRDDLAGLNFATVPTALVECANMRDPADAAMVTSADGRGRIARAITDGTLRYLRDQP